MKAIVSLSGGLDSTVLLALCLRKHSAKEVGTVSFSYGSKHNHCENQAAERVAAHYGVEWRLVELERAMAGFRSDLLLSGGAIPYGHYEASNMARTVVPGRNLIFLSLLMGIAWSKEAGEVWIGVHAGDHLIYPDCRPEFLNAMGEALLLGSDGKVVLQSPMEQWKKVDIVREGQTRSVPFQLTRTCYSDQAVACGKCGSCQERLEAFALNGLEDPLPYETRELLSKRESIPNG